MSEKSKKRNSIKPLILLLVLVLLVGCVVGGTIAWLMATPVEVTNTFVAGNIGELDLVETKGTVVEGNRQFMVVPGKPIEKDPKVSFSGANVDAYVFVKIEGTGWSYADGVFQTADGNLSFTIDTNVWTPVAGKAGVFYQVVTAGNALNGVEVIENSTITVKDTIKANTIEGIVNAAKTLSFKAYAIQKDNVGTVADAWTLVSNP